MMTYYEINNHRHEEESENLKIYKYMYALTHSLSLSHTHTHILKIFLEIVTIVREKLIKSRDQINKI